MTDITITGNLTADPELRTTGTGKTVVNFSIADTKRKYNRQTKTWEDGDTLFLRCSAWNDLAQHIATSLTKGTRVVATGELSQRSYQTRTGENRTVVELKVNDIGASLRNATAVVTRAVKQPTQQSEFAGEQQQPASHGFNDSWSEPTF